MSFARALSLCGAIAAVAWAALGASNARADLSPPRAGCTLPPAPGAPEPSDPELDRAIHCRGNHCDIDRRFVDHSLENLTPISRGARIVPSIVDGRPIGFKLYAIRPRSVFARLLLKNGDRLLTINGLDLSSPDRALETYAKLRAADHLVVALERRGAPFTLDYSIR